MKKYGRLKLDRVSYQYLKDNVNVSKDIELMLPCKEIEPLLKSVKEWETENNKKIHLQISRPELTTEEDNSILIYYEKNPLGWWSRIDCYCFDTYDEVIEFSGNERNIWFPAKRPSVKSKDLTFDINPHSMTIVKVDDNYYWKFLVNNIRFYK